MGLIVFARPRTRQIVLSVVVMLPASVASAATPSPVVAQFEPALAQSGAPLAARTAQTPWEPTGVVTLRDAVVAALRGNPSLATFPWELRALEARAVQAGLRPNPEIGIETENFAGSGDRNGFDQAETTLWLSQLVEVGGKRAKRQRVAEMGRSAVAWDYEAARMTVLIETSRAFLRVLAAQERYGILEELVAVARDTVRTAEARFRSGAAPAVEWTRALVSRASAQVELESVTRELRVRRVALAAMWGSSKAGFSAATGDFETVDSLPPLSALEPLVASNPLAARSAAELDYRGAVVELEASRRLPNPTVQLGARRFDDGDDQALVMQVAVPLPVFDRNQGALLAARHDLGRAKAEQLARERSLGVALAVAHEQSLAAYDRVTAFRDETIPAARRAFAEALDAYKKGRFRYLDVLDAQRTLFELRANYVESLADYHMARIAIEEATAHPLHTGDTAAQENVR